MTETKQALGPNQLPAPRLEFRWTAIESDESIWECVYSLVIPLREFDIRREDKAGNKISSEQSLEIGKTKCTRGKPGKPIADGVVDTPFRDGAHAQWDCRSLGGHLPIYAVCGDVASRVELRPERQD